MANGNLTLWAQVNSFTIGNDPAIKGNAFNIPTLPDAFGYAMPSSYKMTTANPYGFLGYPKTGTPEFINNNVGMGFLDDRLLEGLKALIEGECATYSNKYALTVKNNGVEVYREGGFKTHATSAENTKTIVETIFQYLLTISSQLNALNSAFKDHVHPVHNVQGGDTTVTSDTASTAGSAPPVGYFTSQSAAYPGLVQGEAWNAAEQMFIQDSTNIVGG